MTGPDSTSVTSSSNSSSAGACCSDTVAMDRGLLPSGR
jgi:hypothetical protein